MNASSDIFSKTNERINLVLPIALLLLLVLGVSADRYFQSLFGSSSLLAQRLFADILFLNVTHNAFTVMMIASFPELRPWAMEQGRGSAGRFVLKAVTIFFGLFVFFLAALLSDSKWLFAAFGIATIFFPIQHAIAQSLGLSLVYNSKTLEETVKKRRTEWFERRLVLALIVLIVGSVLAIQSNVFWPNVFLPNFFSVELHRGSFGLSTSSALFRLALGLGFVIVGLMFFYPRQIRAKKTVFALRFPIWAYSLVSPLGLFATQIIHGLEYLFVVRKMASASRFDRWKSATLFLLFVVIVFGIFRVVYFDGSIVSRAEAPVWLSVLAALSTAFSFLHYYLDRELFLMRRPTNQQTVGRLLK
ncbi:MAG: hypothetical protein U1E10_02065 [Bdellovibrionales bacterium]|nr:hypothetical protein [Bdellovibrionales bacterium]